METTEKQEKPISKEVQMNSKSPKKPGNWESYIETGLIQTGRQQKRQ